MSASLGLESRRGIEAQRHRILGDGPHHVFGGAGGERRVDLQRDPDLSAHQAVEMGDNRLAYLARVAGEPRRVKLDSAKEAA